MAEEEPCEDCQVAVLGGMTLKICTLTQNPELNCTDLYKRFNKGQLSLGELIETVKSKVPQGSELAEEIEEIEKLANE